MVRLVDLGMQGKVGESSILMWWVKIIRISNGFSGARIGLKTALWKECQWDFLCLTRYGDGIDVLGSSAIGRALDSGSKGFGFESQLPNLF